MAQSFAISTSASRSSSRHSRRHTRPSLSGSWRAGRAGMTKQRSDHRPRRVGRIVKLGRDMGVVTRKRPRRLVLAVAVIALAAALFVAIQAPLSAQTQPRITIVVDGERHFVTADQLQEAADTPGPFTVRTAGGTSNNLPFDQGT